MTPELAGVLIAAVTGLLGWFAGRRTERVSISQYRLGASAFASDWFRDLRAWASEAIDVLSEAAYCAPGRADTIPIDPETCTRCRHRLSALIDRGRFFLPNYMPDEVGRAKPPAFRGLRHPALDYLVAAEQVLSGSHDEHLAEFPSQRAALVEIKRAFVSEVQEILDPRSQNRAIAELIRSTRSSPADKRSALERLSQQHHPDFSVE